MTPKTLLYGKSAVKVAAEKVTWGTSPKAKMYKIEGNEVWVPNSLCKFQISPEMQKKIDSGAFAGNVEGILTVQEWFYNKELLNNN